MSERGQSFPAGDAGAGRGSQAESSRLGLSLAGALLLAVTLPLASGAAPASGTQWPMVAERPYKINEAAGNAAPVAWLSPVSAITAGGAVIVDRYLLIKAALALIVRGESSGPLDPSATGRLVPFPGRRLAIPLVEVSADTARTMDQPTVRPGRPGGGAAGPAGPSGSRSGRTRAWQAA